ncbi:MULTISPECIES: hypothetical protein, partial [unclassified Bartonella]
MKLSDMRDNDTKRQSENFAKKLHYACSFLCICFKGRQVDVLKHESVLTASITIIAKNTGNNGAYQ